MNRRQFVYECFGGLFATALSGCSGLSRHDRRIRIEKVTLVNFDEEEPKNLAVKIRYDGSEIHNETHTISPKENQIAGTVRITDLPEELGEYTIEASLLNEPKTKYVDVSPPDFRTCVNFDIQVFDDGKIGVLPRKCDATD